jgi:hypothetical protein
VARNLAQTEGDPGLGQIVRRHLDADFVTDREADEMLAHLARNMGQHFVLIIVQRDLEHRSRQNRFNDAFQLDRLLYAHNYFFIKGKHFRRQTANSKTCHPFELRHIN